MQCAKRGILYLASRGRHNPTLLNGNSVRSLTVDAKGLSWQMLTVKGRQHVLFNFKLYNLHGSINLAVLCGSLSLMQKVGMLVILMKTNLIHLSG